MSIAEDIKADVEKGLADLRKDAPGLLAALGVNQENEHAIFHAVLLWAVRAIEAGAVAEAAVIVK